MLDFLLIFGAPDRCVDLVTLFEKLLDDMTGDKAARACHKGYFVFYHC
jgi:hypothetical protein